MAFNLLIQWQMCQRMMCRPGFQPIHLDIQEYIMKRHGMLIILILSLFWVASASAALVINDLLDTSFNLASLAESGTWALLVVGVIGLGLSRRRMKH